MDTLLLRNQYECMAKEKALRVLLIDDHPLLRRGVATLINSDEIFEVCGEVSVPRKSVAAVKARGPDVVVLDLTFEGGSGIELLKELKIVYPALKVLVLSMHDEAIYAGRALRAGAAGYVMKQAPPEVFLFALRQVASGEVFISEAMKENLINQLNRKNPSGIASPIELLSDRELDVFNLIGNGMGTRQIAAKLALSVKTIETHRAHIKEKLGIETAPQLTHQAVQWVNSEEQAADAVAVKHTGSERMLQVK